MPGTICNDVTPTSRYYPGTKKLRHSAVSFAFSPRKVQNYTSFFDLGFWIIKHTRVLDTGCFGNVTDFFFVSFPPEIWDPRRPIYPKNIPNMTKVQAKNKDQNPRGNGLPGALRRTRHKRINSGSGSKKRRGPAITLHKTLRPNLILFWNQEIATQCHKLCACFAQKGPNVK